MEDRLFALLNVACVVALFVTGWLATGYEIVPGVETHDLGPCALDRYREQGVLVLDCVGQNMIRVWLSAAANYTSLRKIHSFCEVF